MILAIDPGNELSAFVLYDAGLLIEFGKIENQALLDDDPAKKRLTIAGVRVLGTRADLARIAHATKATALLVAAPTADAELITSLTTLADQADETLIVKVLPAVSELIDGHVDVATSLEFADESRQGVTLRAQQ